MKPIARRLAVPTLSLAVLATGAFAIGAWAEDDDADRPPPRVASPHQADDDIGPADAAGDDSMLDGVDDVTTIDAAEPDDAPPTLFFDAPDLPGSPPEAP